MELSLIKGEIVILTRRVDQNWYEGRIGSRKGIFPSSYIDVLAEPGETRGIFILVFNREQCSKVLQQALLFFSHWRSTFCKFPARLNKSRSIYSLQGRPYLLAGKKQPYFWHCVYISKKKIGWIIHMIVVYFAIKQFFNKTSPALWNTLKYITKEIPFGTHLFWR